MKYWYIKESWHSGHGDFNGFRELIYRGNKIPIEYISRYIDEDVDTDDKIWKVKWVKLNKYTQKECDSILKSLVKITRKEFEKITKIFLNIKQEKEIVKHNIQQAKEIIYNAERVNKGMYVHDINRRVGILKILLKDKNVKKFLSEEFIDLCKYKQRLASDLYMTEKKI